VGAVHLAVVSLAPWSDYVDSMQPNFQLTADEALERVLRVGQLRRRLETDSAALSVGARQGGSEATAPAASARPASRSASELAMGDPKRDAMTDYWAATALYQEVQLLNRYIGDAAIPKGFVPYVVRLQLTLLPRYRGAPYDAYSSISFFTTGERRLNQSVWARSVDGGADSDAPSPVAGSAPRVLPLLVTDNLEAALATDEYERSRKLAVAAAGTVGTAQVGIGAERSKGLAEQTAGLDLNSLLTVTRLSENTLRVRLGAMQQGSQRFAMVPRTHKITLLVMVPEKAQAALQVIARTEMVHAETGRTLQPRTPTRIALLKAELGGVYGVASIELVNEFFRLAQLNAQQEFLTLAARNGVERPHLLWVDTLGLLSGGQYSSNIVDLDGPRFEVAPQPPPIQTVYLLDDGTKIVGELVGGRHLTIDPIEVELHVGDKTLPGVRVIPVDGGRALRFECRSLRERGLDPSSLRIRLRIRGEMVDYDQVEYRRPKPKPLPKKK
ncbi:MAG: hypothetical protein ACYS0E_17120, partial [Planctomycetota bacterium]